MSSPLPKYLRRTLAAQTVGVLVALTALLQMLEMLDVTTDILKRHLGIAGVLHYAMLRIPSEFVLALPLAVLIGSLFTFYTLARNHELIAIRAAGIRFVWIVKSMLPVILVLAAVQFVVADRVVPRAEAALADWWQASELPDDDDARKAEKLLWFRTDDGLVSVRTASQDGRRLEAVTVYRRGKDGQYRGRLTADSAEWADNRWHLRNLSTLTLDGRSATRRHEDQSDWPTNLNPRDLRRLDSPQVPLSSSSLSGVLAGERVGDRPSSYYRTALYRSYAAPLALVVMLLLALPATRAVQRSGEGGGSLLMALGSGLSFTLAMGLLGSLGQGGRLPAVFAAVAPLVIFGALGLVWLRHYDRT